MATKSFADKLQETKVSKTVATKKSAVPVLDNVPDSVKTAAAEYLKKVKAKKELEADIALYGAEVIAYVSPIQDKNAFAGDFKNSYKVPADGDNQLMVTTKNVFSINPDDELLIKKLFGARISEFVTEKLEVLLKEEVFTDEKLQNELMELLGDNFEKFFKTFTSMKVKEDYDEKIYAFAKTQKKLDEIRTIIAPSKPSLK